MEKSITLKDKTFKPYIPYAEIERAIDGVAARVNADYRDSEDVPVVLCVLNGAIIFTAELLKRLEFNCELMSVKLSSYQGTESTGTVLNIMGITGTSAAARSLSPKT